MRGCAFAAAIVGSAWIGGGLWACHESEPQTPVPPLTSSRTETAPLPIFDAAPAGDAAVGPIAASPEAHVVAAFVDLPAAIDAAACTEVLVALVRGNATAMGETLKVGDVLVVQHGEPFELKGAGTVVSAKFRMPSDRCANKARPPTSKSVVRSNAAPELRWAGGTMAAHLDVGTKVSPDLYLGRLEGTAGVGEHSHPGSWEILAAIEADGTFVLDGTEGHLGSRQIVIVPPGSKHAWKPEPGSKLVAIQMYEPPGPEQRFVALAASEKAAKDAGARDAAR